MAWIKVEMGLERHPKLMRLARAMRWDVSATIGSLIRLWFWILEYGEDGILSKFTPEEFLVGIVPEDQAQPFLNSLIESGFVDKNAQGELRICNWLNYAGTYLISKYRTNNPEKLEGIFQRNGYESYQSWIKTRPKYAYKRSSDGQEKKRSHETDQIT